MYCNNCGCENAPDARVCTTCGVPLQGSVPTPSKAPVPPVPPTPVAGPVPQPKPGNKNKVLLIVAIVLGVLLIAVIGVLLFVRFYNPPIEEPDVPAYSNGSFYDNPNEIVTSGGWISNNPGEDPGAGSGSVSTDEPAAEPTTQATTEPATKAQTLGSAYKKVIKDYQKKYGKSSFSASFATGLCYAELLDFDNDGTDELFVAYNTNRNSDSNFKYEIWTYTGSKAKKLCTRKVQTMDYDCMKTIMLYREIKTGRIFLEEVYDFEYEYASGAWFSKSGNSFKKFYKAETQESWHYIDGKDYSDDDFPRYFDTMNYIEIGSDYFGDNINNVLSQLN